MSTRTEIMKMYYVHGGEACVVFHSTFCRRLINYYYYCVGTRFKLNFAYGVYREKVIPLPRSATGTVRPDLINIIAL